MDGNQKNYWGQPNLTRVCFGLSANMEHNLRELQPPQIAKEFNSNISLSQSPFNSDSYHLPSESTLLPNEGDQVVPSPQRRPVFGGHQREAKPLPPLPNPEEFLSDEAADSEVEFFTSDRQRLLPKSYPKAICRGTNKDCGKVNRAYQDNSLRDGGAGTGSLALSWPSRDGSPAGRGSWFGVKNWSFGLQREDNQHADVFGSKQPEQHHPTRNRFSCSGLPSQAQNCFSSPPAEKPEIPPRIPITKKPVVFSKMVSGSEEDKPPKIPPRVPLVPPCPPRTPSPRSLPIYINGVMPVTQSFAADPHYVSKALQKQNERAPPAAQLSPCIVPILKDGKQASSTHYILLPPDRPAHTQRRERLLSEPHRTASTGFWLKR